MRWMSRGVVLLAMWALSGVAAAQESQVVDAEYKPGVAHPTYRADHGPVVMVDEAHSNVHTAGGQYAPFAKVLRTDGYRVVPFATQITKRALKKGRVLVIANALSKKTAEDWNAPPESAYTDDEKAFCRALEQREDADRERGVGVITSEMIDELKTQGYPGKH